MSENQRCSKRAHQHDTQGKINVGDSFQGQSNTFCFVCVFGAQVKEKEKARKEYKKAVEKGHGAYLMDQDAPVCLPSF